MSAGAAAAAASAAAKAEHKRRDEEERMTNYTEAELAEGWEFKILRSTTGAFRKPEVLRRVCEEESKAGWTLVEKFDNSRMRFKRLVSAGSNDYRLDFDPYRIYVGMTPTTWFLLNSVVAIGVLAIIFAMSAAIAVSFARANRW